MSEPQRHFDAAGPVGRYWLAHGGGFTVVDSQGSEIGVVEALEPRDEHGPERLVVRSARGGLRSRHTVLDTRALATVVPESGLFVVRPLPDAVAPSPRARPTVRPAAEAAATAAGRAAGTAVRWAGVAASAARSGSRSSVQALHRADAALQPHVRAGAAGARRSAVAGAGLVRRFAHALAAAGARAAADVRRRTPELLAAAREWARTAAREVVALLCLAHARARPLAARAAQRARLTARGGREATLSAAATAAAAWRARTAAPAEVEHVDAAEREPSDSDAPLTREARPPRRLVVARARQVERVPQAADGDE
jgi:hypothetical protein